MKKQLEVGDKIRRYEIMGEVDFIYTITSVTKTLAKTSEGHSFERNIDYNTTKPMEHYIGEVNLKGKRVMSPRYYLIK